MATTYVLPDPQTLADCDRALQLTAIAYRSAEERGDFLQAAGAYERRDHLLEVRSALLRIPAQRPAQD